MYVYIYIYIYIYIYSELYLRVVKTLLTLEHIRSKSEYFNLGFHL